MLVQLFNSAHEQRRRSVKNSFYYKSGGGITIDSDIKKEYNELIEKIYIGR